LELAGARKGNYQCIQKDGNINNFVRARSWDVGVKNSWMIGVTTFFMISLQWPIYLHFFFNIKGGAILVQWK
jgi:hypothetical protein